ncbi:MAG: hypothetical protein QGG64_01705 [Candidatus Latescibacteria bacterium]|nr:hypothetical protein [Candidatus Latescibacterota bacterium]
MWEADPHEFNNLAFDPEMKEQLESMRANLKAWMEEQNNPGWF